MSRSNSPLRNPRLQLMLVIGLITASGFWIWFFADYQPQMDQIETLVEHESRLRASNQQARRTVAALGLDRIREAIEAYDQQAEHVSALIPPDTVEAEVLPTIANVATRFNVEQGDIVPQPERREGGFVVRSFEVTASGEYHDVAAFMTELLSLDRITRITNTRFDQVRGTTDTPQGLVLQFTVDATFTLHLYSTPVAADESEDGAATADQGGEE